MCACVRVCLCLSVCVRVCLCRYARLYLYRALSRMNAVVQKSSDARKQIRNLICVFTLLLLQRDGIVCYIHIGRSPRRRVSRVDNEYYYYRRRTYWIFSSRRGQNIFTAFASAPACVGDLRT